MTAVRDVDNKTRSAVVGRRLRAAVAAARREGRVLVFGAAIDMSKPRKAVRMKTSHVRKTRAAVATLDPPTPAEDTVEAEDAAALLQMNTSERKAARELGCRPRDFIAARRAFRGQ